MSNEQKFVDGLRVFKPNEKAPDFVIADLVIERDDFSDWMADRGDKVRITIKRSQGGKLYAVENDWKPKEGSRSAPRRQETPEPAGGGGFEDDSIPFSPLGKRRHW